MGLGAGQPPQVALSTPVTHDDGTRQAILFFAAETGAEIVLRDGARVAVDRLSIRATEYTVGPNGPKAMPAELPADTGYTYAVELSADEAEALSADRVEFDRPVQFYVDNFLGFPVGIPVPVGYYDRKVGEWLGSENGSG